MLRKILGLFGGRKISDNQRFVEIGLDGKPVRHDKDDIFEPTGQPMAEVLAIRRRAETETNDEKEKRLSLPKKVVKRWIEINCPVCNVGISYDSSDIDILELEPYPYHDRLKLCGQGECPSCKKKISFTYKEDGEIRARDTDFDKIKSEAFQKTNELYDKISELESALDEEESEEKQDKISKKIEILEERIRKHEERFEKKESAYLDKIERIRDRTIEKYY